MKHWPFFLACLAVVGAAAWYVLGRRFPVKEGLGRRDGIRVILEVEKDKLPQGMTLDTGMTHSVRQILAGRMNALGGSGAEVRSIGSDRFLVEIPAGPPQLVNAEYQGVHASLKPGITTIGSKGTDIVLRGADVPAKAASIRVEATTVTVTADAPGVQVGGSTLPVGQSRKLSNGDSLRLSQSTVYRLNWPQDPQSTLNVLLRRNLVEFRLLRNVKSARNPTARYWM